MTNRLTRAAAAGAVAALALGGVALAAPPAGAHENNHHAKRVAHLDPLNNSGVTGTAAVRVHRHENKLNARVAVRGAAPGLVHAQHIHYGEQAAHECPTVRDDVNRDGRINVVEGVPRYGPIAVSLTTSGDTSPKSALDVARFSSAPEGRIDYQRQISTSKDVARAIRNGEGVLVVHGVDYNKNGEYDFAGAGESELNAALPAEATDPALCGVLR